MGRGGPLVEGRGFESRSSCHAGTLGKSYTRRCLWRFGVKLRHGIFASFALYVAMALPVNSVGVTIPAKIICTTLGIWGAKSFFYLDLRRLSPPSPYAEPPLETLV